MLRSRAVLVLLCVITFVALVIYMYFRLRHNGVWWTVGVGAIAIVFAAFLLDWRRQTRGTQEQQV